MRFEQDACASKLLKEMPINDPGLVGFGQDFRTIFEIDTEILRTIVLLIIDSLPRFHSVIHSENWLNLLFSSIFLVKILKEIFFQCDTRLLRFRQDECRHISIHDACSYHLKYINFITLCSNCWKLTRIVWNEEEKKSDNWSRQIQHYQTRV